VQTVASRSLFGGGHPCRSQVCQERQRRKARG